MDAAGLRQAVAQRPATARMRRPQAVSAGSGRCWVRTNVGLADGFTGSRRAAANTGLNLRERSPCVTRGWRSTAPQPRASASSRYPPDITGRPRSNGRAGLGLVLFLAKEPGDRITQFAHRRLHEARRHPTPASHSPCAADPNSRTFPAPTACAAAHIPARCSRSKAAAGWVTLGDGSGSGRPQQPTQRNLRGGLGRHTSPHRPVGAIAPGRPQPLTNQSASAAIQ